MAQHSPVEAFIAGLSVKEAAKVVADIAFLEDHGPLTPFPRKSKIQSSDELFELRVKVSGKQIRVLFTFVSRARILLLHGYTKRDEKQVDRESKVAEARLLDWKWRQKEKKDEAKH